MRNTLPLLSRPQPVSGNNSNTPTPSIRLVSATPLASGSSSTDLSSLSTISAVAPFANQSPSQLTPRPISQAPRKRLVPKKSKLGLLSAVGVKAKDKAGSKDFSDVVRRIGGQAASASTGRSGFEIYVDQGNDQDLGEIVVVKKKKSRLGLDGMKWGALGEVTNVPSISKEKEKSKDRAPVEHLKVKGEDSQRWWSMGRSRKDSKEKGKEKEQQPPSRAVSPEPPRNRFDSIDSGVTRSQKTTGMGTVSSMNTLLSIPSSSDSSTPTPTSAGLLAPPSNTNAPATGSIALRAMKSMRSIARMKSWATLTGATHLHSEKEGNAITNTNTNATISNGKTKEKKEEKKKKKEKKEEKKGKDKEKKKSRDKTLRNSGSSFEAGAPSNPTSPIPPRDHIEDIQKTAKKKQSILGLGLPSTMRLGTVRNLSNASSASSVGAASSLRPPTTAGRLSVDSAHLTMNAQGRPSSVLSTNSSLRPPSTASGVSGHSDRSQRSSSGSAVSIRWDEAGIRQSKEMQRKERKTRKASARTSVDSATKKSGRESRKSSEARRRVPISEIFPETMEERPAPVSPMTSHGVFTHPIVTVEEATTDGHSDLVDEEDNSQANATLRGIEASDETPKKRFRPRPLSEQPLGKMRPLAVHSDADAGVISILDAATDELASLINRLDLEATPASKHGTPFRPSPLTLAGSPSRALLPRDGSPIKRRSTSNHPPLPTRLRESAASISSLRPYAKSQSTEVARTLRPKKSLNAAGLIGQQIAPWSALDWQVSPKRPAPKPSTLRPSHKRTMTPAPACEAPPVFHPLRPSKSVISPVFSHATASSTSLSTPRLSVGGQPSSCTFGSETVPKLGVKIADEEDEEDDVTDTPTPVFKRTSNHIRSGSLASAFGRRASKFSLGSLFSIQGAPIAPEAKRGLGLAGTMGSSTEPSVDTEDPDSDIPDELQVILAGQSDDENTNVLSLHAPSRPLSPLISPPPVDIPLPPTPPLAASRISAHFQAEFDAPIFRAQLIDDDANLGDIDEGGSEEDDTKKSFDFTGELQKLNESGASDRRSFVEQLENAFRTPASIDLGLETGFLAVDAPPLPQIPLCRPPPAEDVAPRSVSNEEFTTFTTMAEEATQDNSYCDSASTDTLEHLLAECEEDVCRSYSVRKSNPSMKSKASTRSKASDGQLNVDFKFGGSPVPPLPEPATEKEERPLLTLSDIIPPPSHVRSHSTEESMEEDSSVLKSIMARASALHLSVPRPRANSDSSFTTQRDVSNIAMISPHSRNPSEASFTGFDSFEEVRRGFEFGPNRPAFYPPPIASRFHGKHESIYSIASVSSYGATLDSGQTDPFGYAPSRPTSEDMSVSMSMSVDDTFSFMKRETQRRRVDSDASSFYFRPGGRSSLILDPSRRNRHRDSTLSVVSNAPPVSLYNRGYPGHHRSDSNTSSTSVAQTYARFGAHGGRAAWARHHRQDPSVGSVASDYSAMRGLDRPGLGDKMFEMDHGMPLTSITASPTESTTGDFYSQQSQSQSQPSGPSSFDSIIDVDRKTFEPDSIFDKTGYRSSVYSSDGSVFGFDTSDPGQGRGLARPPVFLPPNHFRPLSMMSVTSVHSAHKEDDTMISMIGGGHVRRRSIDSMVDGSPCVRVGIERKKHLREIGRVLKFDQAIQEVPEVPTPSPAKDSPVKTRLIAKPSIASTSSQQFGGERMIMARKGLLERQSLEESALIAQGEDLLASLRSQPVFSRPGPSRSRSSTVTSCSGGETPPLSSSDGSSVSGGSQSSIDIAHLSNILSSCTRPSSTIAGARARARARGAGHRRRISQARASRSSVYETIQEESMVLSSPSPEKALSSPESIAKSGSPSLSQAIFVVDSDSQSFSEDWNDECGIVGLRKYYALQDEAMTTVAESKQVWSDTPFSIFAVQSFEPPTNRGGMQAMLEHSRQTYGPLPSELRPCRVRSRTSSRASPYPVRSLKSWIPVEQPNALNDEISYESFNISKSFASPARPNRSAPLREITANPNINVASLPVLDAKPFAPFTIKLDEPTNSEKTAVDLPQRPRVTSSARRTALGWKKRSTGKSSTSERKENMSLGSITNPSDSLRISRPRPRGRQTSARATAARA